MRDAVVYAACNKYRNASSITTVIPASTCLRSATWPTGACIISDDVSPLMPIKLNVQNEELKEAASTGGILGIAWEGLDALPNCEL